MCQAMWIQEPVPAPTEFMSVKMGRKVRGNYKKRCSPCHGSTWPARPTTLLLGLDSNVP